MGTWPETSTISQTNPIYIGGIKKVGGLFQLGLIL